MSKALRRAGRRLRKAGAALIGLPASLWRFALRLRGDAGLRERTLAQAVFAGIFALGLASFDFLLTGGVELTPDFAAVASEPRHAALTTTRLAEAVEAPPLREVAELQPLDEMAAPNEDLLGGPETELSAWRLSAGDELPQKPEPIAISSAAEDTLKSPQRL